MSKRALPLVDTHFHVFDAGAAVPSARYRPPYAADLKDWHARLAGLGDMYGVVVQTSFLGTDNAALLAALQAMPGRLRGVAVVGPEVTDAELATLHAAGVRGIRLNLYGDPDWQRIATVPWRGLFSRIAGLGWHVELHTRNGDGAMVLAQLDAALGDTGAPVVLDHFGRPGPAGTADAIFDVASAVRARRQVWVKISAPYRLASPQDWHGLAQRWREVVGDDRLLWGSDWPWTNHEAPARVDECRMLAAWPGQGAPGDSEAAGVALSAALRWRNAAALYGFAVKG
ncbi:putative metal-dependent hydrolase, TIM-barrel fold [Cupriavidus necator]|uniref:Hydrolase n=1 Tax=Cupriavidus necator (strain ATCC 17699 / DSM 428 / KCTC 22496 / NCIMB 10442 / H16 / Stanier 337) TaxID=381666 RepID=Q0K3W2_CUPNH|nr:amidohydrolase family protein [Cupriavidus necator]QCC03225.1 hydrolase [Cupriavidus necator H16]QQB80281.1 amidohydrolase family protein [Cupriavidus necator]WKA44552.1 amidohydrolase family protein [Cupriavidus necator]CAJ95312.1 predicted metal-dependent hydrolase of the TIM-barrel fold [Cupriavidus necator H16]